MAKLLVKVFATEDRKEEGTPYGWPEERPISAKALAKGKTASGEKPVFAETWVSPDVDLSQYGWVKSNAKVSVYAISCGFFHVKDWLLMLQIFPNREF